MIDTFTPLPLPPFAGAAVVEKGRVRRPIAPWSDNVRALLVSLAENGFQFSPRHLETRDDGFEYLSLIPGEVSDTPPSEPFRQTETLVSAARALRGYHDATAFRGELLGRASGWMFPPRSPVEVVCHADFAPYNVVLEGDRVVGIIDFDTAHPGPRSWDIAHALYRWAPLTASSPDPAFRDIGIQLERVTTFCAAYGRFSVDDPADSVCDRLSELIRFMREAAAAGDAKFAADIATGHADLYADDIAYVRSHKEAINQAVRAAQR